MDDPICRGMKGADKSTNTATRRRFAVMCEERKTRQGLTCEIVIPDNEAPSSSQRSKKKVKRETYITRSTTCDTIRRQDSPEMVMSDNDGQWEPSPSQPCSTVTEATDMRGNPIFDTVNKEAQTPGRPIFAAASRAVNVCAETLDCEEISEVERFCRKCDVQQLQEDAQRKEDVRLLLELEMPFL